MIRAHEIAASERVVEVSQSRQGVTDASTHEGVPGGALVGFGCEHSRRGYDARGGKAREDEHRRGEQRAGEAYARKPFSRFTLHQDVRLARLPRRLVSGLESSSSSVRSFASRSISDGPIVRDSRLAGRGGEPLMRCGDLKLVKLYFFSSNAFGYRVL